MKTYFTASIEWVTYENGGRRKIQLQGIRYCPLIKLYQNEGSFEWSIDFICPDYNKTNIINFCFLVEAVLTSLIELGRTYDILEGARNVAKIRVISYETK